MKRLYYTNKRMICIFAVLFIIGVYATTNTYPIKLLHHVSAFCYLTIIILWAATIRIRIVDKEVRIRILVSCAFMVLLFFLRMCKYTYFPEDAMIREYIWYSYMIPRTFFPLFMFTATLYVEPVGSRRMVRRIEIFLIIISTLFAAVAMTNNLHSLVYKITVHPDKEYTHEIFYYILMAWRIALTVGLLVILFRKCSLSSARRKWYIPVICIAVSSILLLWYNIYGGAPKVWGYKLFQLQEALCIPYMMAFESIIQIGMIPANNGYRKLFEHSSINACIFDKDGNPVHTSLGWSQTGQDDDHRISKEPVSGGYITWIEDISAINRLNRELEEVAEELRDENDLIIQENEVRAERVSFETKNRLYNRISSAVQSRAVTVNELLTRADADTGTADSQSDIVYAALLSAYIKRMGNLVLLGDEKGTVSSAELKLAIIESFDYLRLNGCVCLIEAEEETELPAKAALLAYELFEDTIEDVRTKLGTVSVELSPGDMFTMNIALDTPAEGITSDWKKAQTAAAGGRISARSEDETYYIRLEVKV